MPLKIFTLTARIIAGARQRGALAVLALVCTLAACQSSPPVQEMSDARQAIAVAREAGADEYAAEDLRAAEAYLDSAQQKLSERSYTLARRDAVQAKNKALAALAAAENPDAAKTP